MRRPVLGLLIGMVGFCPPQSVAAEQFGVANSARPVDPTAIAASLIPGVKRALGASAVHADMDPEAAKSPAAPGEERAVLRAVELLVERPDRFRLRLAPQELLAGHNATSAVAASGPVRQAGTRLVAAPERRGGRTTMVAYAVLGVAMLMFGASLLMTLLRHRNEASW